MPHTCEAYTHTWTSVISLPLSSTKPNLFCLSLGISVVLLMFKLPDSFPTYTPEQHSFWSGLGSAPLLSSPQGCIGFSSANSLHRNGGGEQLGPHDMRIWGTSRSLLSGKESQASGCIEFKIVGKQLSGSVNVQSEPLSLSLFPSLSHSFSLSHLFTCMTQLMYIIYSHMLIIHVCMYVSPHICSFTLTLTYVHHWLSTTHTHTHTNIGLIK